MGDQPRRRLPLPESIATAHPRWCPALVGAFRAAEDEAGYAAAAALVADFDDDARRASACPDCRGYHRPGRCPAKPPLSP